MSVAPKIAKLAVWACALVYWVGAVLTAVMVDGGETVVRAGAIVGAVLFLLGFGLHKRWRVAHVLSLLGTLGLVGGTTIYFSDPLAWPLLDGQPGRVENVFRGVILGVAAVALVALVLPSTWRHFWRRTVVAPGEVA
jgi:hypothetical protein